MVDKIANNIANIDVRINKNSSKKPTFNENSDNSEQSSTLLKCACSGSEKSKADGRCKPRSQKQIEAYKRNFSSRKSVELRINELDLRLRHLQSLALSLLSS